MRYTPVCVLCYIVLRCARRAAVHFVCCAATQRTRLHTLGHRTVLALLYRTVHDVLHGTVCDVLQGTVCAVLHCTRQLWGTALYVLSGTGLCALCYAALPRSRCVARQCAMHSTALCVFCCTAMCSELHCCMHVVLFFKVCGVPHPTCVMCRRALCWSCCAAAHCAPHCAALCELCRTAQCVMCHGPLCALCCTVLQCAMAARQRVCLTVLHFTPLRIALLCVCYVALHCAMHCTTLRVMCATALCFAPHFIVLCYAAPCVLHCIAL